MLKVARIALGVLLMFTATGFLMEGGLVRHRMLDTTLEWRWLAIGLPLFSAGWYLSFRDRLRRA